MMQWYKKLPRIKKIMLRNFVLTLAAYHVAIGITLLSMILGSHYYPFSHFTLLVFLIYVTNGIVLWINLSNPFISKQFSDRMLMAQIINWFLLFSYWNFLMVDHRSATLMTAMMVLAFLYSYSTLWYSFLLAFLVSVVHLATTYMGIHFSHQPGDFNQEWIDVFAFFCSTMLVAYLLHRLSSLLRNQASNDHLTKLLNRRAMNKVIHSEFVRCKRYHQQAALVMIDLDDFKIINDTYGHHGGDVVLIEAAKLLKNELREVDFIGRWGGEEFIALLVEVPAAKAYKPIKRILSLLREKEIISGSDKIRITFSAGLADLFCAESIEEAIKEADRLLYVAKSRGKNCVIYDTAPK